MACAAPARIKGLTAACPLPHCPNPLSFWCQIPWDWSRPGLQLGISAPLSLPCSIAAAVLNATLPAPVQAAAPVQASSPAQPRPPAQPQTLFQTQPLLQTTPAILPQPTAATATAPTPKPVDTPSQITVQPAGFAFSPGIVSRCPPLGLTRDGPNLGPRVELTLPTREEGGGGPAP